MKRLLKHIANILSVILGIVIVKAGIWLYEADFQFLVGSGAMIFIGLLFVISGIFDYVNAVRKWIEKIKREKEEQLRREQLKKLLEEEERRREEHRKRTAELMKSIERIATQYPKMTIETTGQILKKLGIKREKRKKVKPKKVLELKKPEPEKKKPSMLEPLIQELLNKEELYIDRNMHYGKLRGKDIARALAKELKRKGIKYELKMDDYDAFIKIKGGGKCGAKNC